MDDYHSDDLPELQRLVIHMSDTTLPAAWASLLEHVKPFGETDIGEMMSGAGELLGFGAAQMKDGGRRVASFGNASDFSDAHTIELPYSGNVVSLIWDQAPSAEQEAGAETLFRLVDIASLAPDRRVVATSTPMMAPSGSKDRLTNTIDRDAFTDYLTIEFGAGPSDAAVMVIGLDGMTVVNETMSHTVGDVVLAETADRLRATLRSCDIISRLGGDVFGIYCPSMTLETATALSGRLQAAIGAAHRRAIQRAANHRKHRYRHTGKGREGRRDHRQRRHGPSGSKRTRSGIDGRL